MAEVIVRLYGDSLGLPRATDGVKSADTYFELLLEDIRNRSADRVILGYNRSRGGVRVDELYELLTSDSSYFEQDATTIILIQCGIVDCAPRVIPRWLRALIGVSPAPIRSRIIRFLHDNRRRLLSLGPSWRETPPRRFQRVFASLLRAASDSSAAVVVLNIAPTVPAVEQHSPGLSRAIETYNGMIADSVRVAGPKVRLVDVHQRISQETSGLQRYINERDGHHITRDGHNLYRELTASALESLLPDVCAQRYELTRS